MCGICGVVTFGSRAQEIDEPTLRAMASTMRHRGPDDNGYYVSPDHHLGFGFRRLSIVDLNTGEQPMSNEDDSIWLIYNGEIYNHADHRPGLEARGHRFRSHCDAEVVLHLYEEYGPDCVHHLRGMFAFALWDSRRRRLLLVRDRIGVKPLYFAALNNALLFGSEIKALFGHPALKPRLNEAALALYLTFAATPAPGTLFEGVQKLPPGHRLIVDADSGQRTLERYWQPLPDPDVLSNRLRPEEYVERLEALVRESIGLRLMSDVPYGAFLSGGVDSSLNVALMAELADRPVSTFSVAIEGDAASDELGFARAVAERYGTDHHEVFVNDQDFLDYLPQLVWHQDEPLADPVCVPLHAISEAARRNGTKVVQVGEGADELFAGYTSYAFFTDFHRRLWQPYRYVPGFVRSLVARGASHLLSLDRADVLDRAAQDGELFWGGAIPFYGAHARALFGPGFRASGQGREAVDALYADVDAAIPGASQLDRMIGIELRQRLPELLLMRVDKVTMGSSLEARVPYLDHKLVEFALAVPAEVKYRDGVTKWVLKRVAERVGLDRELVYRRKRGFCGSASNMLSPRLLARAEEEILDSAFARARFDVSFIRKMFAEQRAHQVDHNFRLWNLWNLVAWHTCWLEKPQPDPAAPAEVSV
ncbi:MAG TPA: asparagine synthase (glutamine-hydrolyzing) [Chloroflexota bacterium]|nr:asparagine synthase (glutamine-hydrolyzing) [Chloroflexota bacterium]